MLPLLLPLAGCSRGGGCEAGKVCLRYMAWGNPEQLKVEQDFVARFNQENPDLKVKFVSVPGGAYAQKMTIMLVSNTAPDVMRVDHYVFPSLQEKGYFADLTPLAERDPGFRQSDFFPTAIAEGTVNGRLYGLNVLFGGVLIYYNKTLFRKAGLEDPYELYKKGAWTWDRFREDAIRLTRFKDGLPVVFGTAVPVFPNSVPIVRAFGGELMSPDMRRCVIGSPEAAKGYQFIADLIWRDHAAPTPSQGANSAFTFESGKLGMTFDWMGMTPRYRSVVKSFDWDVVPLPLAKTVVKGNQLVVAAKSQHPEAAWRFVRFMTGVAVETELYAHIRRSFPTRKSVAESPDFLRTTQPPYNTRAFVDSIEGGKALPITDRWQEWTQILSSEIDNLVAGRERSAERALRRAEAKINAALAEPPGF